MFLLAGGAMEAAESENGESGGTSEEGWSTGEGVRLESSVTLRASEVIRDMWTSASLSYTRPLWSY